MFNATENITTYELCSGIPHFSFMDKGYFIDCNQELCEAYLRSYSPLFLKQNCSLVSHNN
jgi:hypothetical protein